MQDEPGEPGAAGEAAALARAEVLYLHGPARMDEQVLAHAGFPHRRLNVGPLRGTAPHRLLANMFRLLFATFQAGRAMAQFHPDAVLATGGYVSAPTMLAAALRRVPIVLYLPDTTPGFAVRLFAPLAKRIALSFQLTKAYFKGPKAIVTGYPLRPEFLHVTKAEARKTFDLALDVPVVTIMGGSTGAHSINLAVADALEPLLHHAQIIHLCGEMDEQRLRQQRAQLDAAIRQRYHLFRYLHKGVAEAMAAADVIVCRAGASVLAELPILRLPAVLVPHPFPRIHQEENADFLAEQGGAVKVLDRELEEGALLTTVLSLLEDHARRETMAAEMGRLARPEAANNIASLVRSVARKRK